MKPRRDVDLPSDASDTTPRRPDEDSYLRDYIDDDRDIVIIETPKVKNPRYLPEKI